MSEEIHVQIPQTPTRVAAGETGAVTLTIRNTDDMPIRVGARVTAAEGTQADWMTLDDMPDAPLAPDAERNVVVQIAVPEDAASRDHAFRVLVFDMDDPGERFVETPLIRFDAEADVPETIDLKPRNEWKDVVPGTATASISAVPAFFVYLIGFVLIFDRGDMMENHDFFIVLAIIVLVVGSGLVALGLRRCFSTTQTFVFIHSVSVALALATFNGTGSGGRIDGDWTVLLLSLALFGWAGWYYWQCWKATENPPLKASDTE